MGGTTGLFTAEQYELQNSGIVVDVIREVVLYTNGEDEASFYLSTVPTEDDALDSFGV